MKLDKEQLKRSCSAENYPYPSSSIKPSLVLSIPPICSSRIQSSSIARFGLHVKHFNSLFPASLMLLYPYISSTSSQNTNFHLKFCINYLSHLDFVHQYKLTVNSVILRTTCQFLYSFGFSFHLCPFTILGSFPQFTSCPNSS